MTATGMITTSPTLTVRTRFSLKALTQNGEPAFYTPNDRGFEREILRRLAFWTKRKAEGG